MSGQYQSLAQQIVAQVGGKGNVTNAFHCQTRLRFSLADERVVDDDALNAIDGVMRVLHSAGQTQVVIGPHVEDVFAEVAPLLDLSQGAAGPAETEKKPSPLEAVIDFVSGTFQPIIPALSGAGMIKAVMALLVTFSVIDSSSQTYYMLNTFADAVFYFLPILLAYCEAQKLKCNPILAAGVAAMMLHPNWTSLVTAGEPVSFFGVVPFTLASYGSSVIPVILVVFVQPFVEKWLDRHIPKAINLVFVPLLTFLVMGTLAFSVLGPIGYIVGQWLAVAFTFLAENAAWAPALLIGGLLPVMVMFGIHNGIAPLGVMQMSQLGYDSIFGPGCFVSNMCQATAGAIVAFRAKDAKTRELATSGSITAYMGITEPVLYGVNLPLKWPLISSMIGGACGGLYAGLTHTHRFATGSSGLPAVLLYIGDDTLQYMLNIVIAMVIGMAVTAVVALALSARMGEQGSEEPAAAEPAAEPATTEALLCPVTGTAKPLSESSDPVFSSLMMGDGAAIDPSVGRVVAPFSGTVTALFPTNHAVGITAPDGAEALIHIGVDTVELNGRGFTGHVRQGDTVTAGQLLVEFDIDAIRAAGYTPQTMVVVTNTPAYDSVQLLEKGPVEAGERSLLRLVRHAADAAEPSPTAMAPASA